MHTMDKREFLTLAGAASAVTVTLGRSVAQNTKVPRVGILASNLLPLIFEKLQQGFNQLGYVEGRNIIFERRVAQGQIERLPDLAAELAHLNVDVICASGAVGARAARKATTTIPIVFAVVLDPVAAGLAASMERPGGNMTGLTSYDPQQAEKQFALLKETLPKLSRLALLSDQDIPRAADGGTNPLEKAYDAAARALGLRPQMLKVKSPIPDLEGAFSEMAKESAEALVMLEVPVTIRHQKQIADLATEHHLPSMLPGGLSGAGGLITYGTTIFDAFPRIPEYVDKILKGAKPGDLPVGTVTRRELIFNLQTARAIGVTIPPELLKRADRVIE